MASAPLTRVTIWNENHAERSPEVGRVYPNGIDGAIAAGLRDHLGDRVALRQVSLDDPDNGLSDDVLDATDVLIWWAHKAHEQVDPTVVVRVHDRVLAGLGLVALHSALHSQIFMRLLGTSCDMRWRESGERQLVWTVSPSHPIARDVPHPIVIPEDEMYSEFFDIPAPDELVFVSSFAGGEIFRSGCCFKRGNGRIFYFSPGHETAPVYYQPEVSKVIANAAIWAHNPSPSPARAKSGQVPVSWFTS